MAWEPGCTEFTVTPSPATSRARVFRNAGHPGASRVGQDQPLDRLADRDAVMATTRPHPRSRMVGTAAWHMATVDNKLRSSAAP